MKNSKKSTNLSKNCKNTKRVIITVTAAAVMLCISCITAFAAVNTGEFITKACQVLKAVICLIGAGLGVWGVVNLVEGYGNDNPGAKSQGMKQTMAGIGLIAIGILLVPVLQNMMSGAMS